MPRACYVYCAAQLSLADALCGTTLKIEGLDGSMIEVPVKDVIRPNDAKVVRCVGCRGWGVDVGG